MHAVFASDILAPLGQAAAFIIALYLFISVILGLALAAGLLFGFAWIREKSELLRKLRPQILELNKAAIAARRGDPLPRGIAENKIVSAVVQVPKVVDNVASGASKVEQKVEQGSDRVAQAVIEFHARTAQVKGMAKAFFLPGLTRRRSAPVQVQRVQEQVSVPEEIEVVQQRPREEPPLEQEIVIVQR